MFTGEGASAMAAKLLPAVRELLGEPKSIAIAFGLILEPAARPARYAGESRILLNGILLP